MSKSPDAFRTISEVADWLGVQAHVLRFWESRFSQVKPVKRAGGRRYYRPNDMRLLGGIKKLLHDDGMTIKGVQRILREEGAAHVARLSQGLDEQAAQQPEPKGNVVPFMEYTDIRPTATQMDMDLGEPSAPQTASQTSAPATDPVELQPSAPAHEPCGTSQEDIRGGGLGLGVLAMVWSCDQFDEAKLGMMAPIARDLRDWLDRVENQMAG